MGTDGHSTGGLGAVKPAASVCPCAPVTRLSSWRLAQTTLQVPHFKRPREGDDRSGEQRPQTRQVTCENSTRRGAGRARREDNSSCSPAALSPLGDPPGPEE